MRNQIIIHFIWFFWQMLSFQDNVIYLNVIYCYSYIWSDIRYLKRNTLSEANFSIWSEIFVRYEAKSALSSEFSFDLKWIFCAIWSAIRYLKGNPWYEAKYSKSAPWSEFFVLFEAKYSCDLKQNPLSEAKFSIWNDFFVRSEAKSAIWNEISVRSEAKSAIWNEIRDLKRIFHVIWSEICSVIPLKRIFRSIWSEIFMRSEAKSAIGSICIHWVCIELTFAWI